VTTRQACRLLRIGLRPHLKSVIWLPGSRSASPSRPSMIRSVRKRRLPKMTCDDIRNTRTHAHNTLLTDVRARRAHTHSNSQHHLSRHSADLMKRAKKDSGIWLIVTEISWFIKMSCGLQQNLHKLLLDLTISSKDSRVH
jgi:hypothetical protein